MVFGDFFNGRPSTFLWWGTEEGVEIRGDLFFRVRFSLESPARDPQSATQKQPVTLTAIYEVNTFRGSLGSLTAVSASTSSVFWVQHWVFHEATRRCLTTVQGRCCTHKTKKSKRVDPIGAKKINTWSKRKSKIAISFHASWIYILFKLNKQ